MESLPSWTGDYLINDEDDFSHIDYLLTFRPYSKLPVQVKERYLKGELALIPFPGSMMLWGSPDYIRLQETQYNAIQIPHAGIGQTE